MAKNADPEYVRLSFSDGPIILGQRTHTGVNETYDLWGGAEASEYFLQSVGGASYKITLEKPVLYAQDVRPAEDFLADALRTLARAWLFAGGSHMKITSRTIVTSDAFESNVDEIEKRLLARENRVAISVSSRLYMDALATYSRPPLQSAIKIAQHAREHFPTKQLLRYYYSAFDNRPGNAVAEGASWSIDLYKVRDLLRKFYRGETSTRSKLGISDSEWSDLGKLLNNNDLRHAELCDKPPAFVRDDIDRLYTTAWRWVRSFLEMQGLPVVPLPQ